MPGVSVHIQKGVVVSDPVRGPSHLPKGRAREAEEADLFFFDDMKMVLSTVHPMCWSASTCRTWWGSPVREWVVNAGEGCDRPDFWLQTPEAVEHIVTLYKQESCL